MTVNAGLLSPRTSCRTLLLVAACSLDDRNIVTLAKFATVIFAASSCAKIFAHTRRHCGSNSSGVFPSFVSGICPLINRILSMPSISMACEYPPSGEGAREELRAIVFTQNCLQPHNLVNRRVHQIPPSCHPFAVEHKGSIRGPATALVHLRLSVTARRCRATIA